MSINGFIIGIAVAWFGKTMVDLWRKNKLGITKKIQDLDNRWVGEEESTFDRAVNSAVATVDVMFTNAEFWRTFFWTVYKKDPSRLDKYYTELKNKVDFSSYLPSQLSPELKAEVNTVKKEIATKIANNIIKANVAKAEGDLSKAIDATAEARKLPNLHSGEAITKPLMEKLIEESKKRQEALKK